MHVLLHGKVQVNMNTLYMHLCPLNEGGRAISLFLMLQRKETRRKEVKPLEDVSLNSTRTEQRTVWQYVWQGKGKCVLLVQDFIFNHVFSWVYISFNVLRKKPCHGKDFRYFTLKYCQKWNQSQQFIRVIKWMVTVILILLIEHYIWAACAQHCFRPMHPDQSLHSRRYNKSFQ